MRASWFRKSSIFVIIVLLILTSIAPSLNAEDPKGDNSILTIWMPGVTEEDYTNQITVSKEIVNSFIDKINQSIELLQQVTSLNSQDGKNITSEEWEQIRVYLEDFINSIISIDEDFPEFNFKGYITELIDEILFPFGHPLWNLLRADTIISLGLGYTWIPYYDYDAFLGTMFRPILSRYIIGFSGSFRLVPIPPFLSMHLKFGKYTMYSLRFNGLFINFGDIGLDKIIGPTLYIGRAYVRM